MHAVIFAAGRGSRMKSLTDNQPKPMINVCGNPILSHVIKALPNCITDAHIIVGYLEDEIREALCLARKGLKIHFHTQTNLNGTFDALLRSRDSLNDSPFLVVNGDDLYQKTDLETLVSSDAFAMLAKHVSRPNRCSHLETESGHLSRIIPKNELPDEKALSHTFTYTGACFLDRRIFDLQPTQISSGEFSLPHTIETHLKTIPVTMIKASFWMPVGTPDELKKASLYLSPIDTTP